VVICTIPAVSVDGNDALAVHGAMQAAVDAARAGQGPQFIECRTYRMGGHAAHDKYESYMPMEVLAEWSDKDPIKRLENVLVEDRALPEGKLGTAGRGGLFTYLPYGVGLVAAAALYLYSRRRRRSRTR